MDVNELRTVVTVLSFVAFLGIAVWAWSRRNAARFDAAAQLPFVDSVPVAQLPSRAERRAAKGHEGAPSWPLPARTPSGGRPTYSSDGRLQ